MLLGYPVAATDENWLHDGIVAILMLALGGEAEPMADWLDHFPAEHREAVRRKTSLSDRLTKAVEAIGALDPPERSHLETCLREQNRLPEAFSSLVSPPLVQEEPADMREKLKALFGTAFGLLSSLGVRDRQYASVYYGTPGHVCGFCGMERLSAPVPDTPREHLDHYLAFSIYTLAGANLRNLAPIGPRCNSSHKLDADMLRNPDGHPRRCFDPFGGHRVEVSLLGSRPLRGPRKGVDILPAWQLTFLHAEADRTEAWDDVFDIRRRYKDDVLDAEFTGWIDHFAVWTQDNPPTDPAGLLQRITTYRRTVVQEEGVGDLMFLKRATFDMLDHCLRNGPEEDRVARWLLSLWVEEEGVVD